MTMYIHKNGQQSGPYEDNLVVDQLRNGQLLPDDMGVRVGETEWQKLGVLFPNTAPAPVQFAAAAPTAVAAPVAVDAAPVQYEAVYRGTMLQKVFFGLCFLVAAIAFVGSAVYLYSLWGSSGNLQADLGRMSYRLLARNMTGGTLVGAFFALIAFLLTFKRKLIRSNGPRIAMRVIFIILLFIGFVNLAAGAITYLNYSPPYKAANKTESNDLLKALEEGTEAVGPYEATVILLPIGAGLFLLGLSGILMTKKLRTE